MKKEKIKKQVLTVLHDVPKTRNSDIELTIEVWKRFYKEHLILGKDQKTHYISIYKLFDLPREDIISRIRRKIQNEEQKYLPTSIKVFEARARKSKEWREYLGYYSKDLFFSKLREYYRNNYEHKKN